jgi:hypothetical protein
LGRWQRSRARPHQAVAANTAAAQLADHVQQSRAHGLGRQLALDLAPAAQGSARSRTATSKARAGHTIDAIDKLPRQTITGR